MNVSTREFQLNQKEYLDKVMEGEEIVLTNRNIPVAYVVKDLQKTEITPIPTEYQIRLIVKMILAELDTRVPENKPEETGTMPIKIEEGFTPKMITQMAKVFPELKSEVLWEDYNLMPVYKTGEDEQFCTTFHQKGLRQRVYPIKKFRGDGTLELEGKYCKSCIEEFLKQDGHLE